MQGGGVPAGRARGFQVDKVFPSAKAALDGVIKDVRVFCGEATQSDDVTIVMVRYDGQG